MVAIMEGIHSKHSYVVFLFFVAVTFCCLLFVLCEAVAEVFPEDYFIV